MENISSVYLLTLTLIQNHYPELLLALLSFFILHLFHRRPQLPLNFPLVGALPHMFLHYNDIHDWSTDLLRQKGYTCVFKGPMGAPVDLLLTCDPANIRHVLTSQFANYNRSKGFSFEFFGDGILNADSDSWAFQRRKAHMLVADTKFRNYAYECTKDKLQNVVLPLLGELAESNQVVDMQDMFMRLIFDITFNFTFGVDPGYFAPDFPTVPLAKAMDEGEQILFYRHVLPYLYYKLQKKFNFGIPKKMKMTLHVIDQGIAQYIAKRKEIKCLQSTEERDGTADLLGSYIDCQKEVGKEGEAFNKFLRDTVASFMGAGRTTNSSALTWFFYLLCKNPHVEEKILQELKVRATNPTFPSMDEIKKLVYMHAAMCESLRLYPPIPFNHKAAINPDILPSGTPVSRSRIIVLSFYAMGRMEDTWGKDCLEFKPERWLSESGEIRHEPSYKFISFGSGPRLCLGKDAAFTQMKAVVAAILTQYHIELEPGFVARPKFSAGLRMKDGLKVRFRSRVSL